MRTRVSLSRTYKYKRNKAAAPEGAAAADHAVIVSLPIRPLGYFRAGIITSREASIAKSLNEDSTL